MWIASSSRGRVSFLGALIFPQSDEPGEIEARQEHRAFAIQGARRRDAEAAGADAETARGEGAVRERLLLDFVELAAAVGPGAAGSPARGLRPACRGPP